MSSATCWRCLARPSADQLATILSRTHITRNPGTVAAFSTSSAVLANPTAKAKGAKVSPKKGAVSGFQMKKKKKSQAKSSFDTPKPGERRAIRRRIVLSNTSALEVKLDQATAENMSNPEYVGSVLGLPDPLIDRLRYLGAFRKTQGWQYFRKPAMLIRKETGELVNEMKNIGNNQISRIYTGQRGSGKSMMLLQAQAIAYQQEWIMINLGEAQFITDGSRDYKSVPQVRPMIFDQPTHLSQLMARISSANAFRLRRMPLALQHDLPVAIRTGANVNDLLFVGEKATEHAYAIFDAFMKELTAPGRPPILITLDGIAHLMRNSAYKNPSFEPVHAHDLTFVRWFMSYLSGEKKLPNGGMVLAATSASNEPEVETLDFRLHQLEVKQAIEKGLPSPRADAELPDPILPFLLATGQQPNPVPQPVNHKKYDTRVFDVLGSPYNVVAGNKTASAGEVQVHNLKGVNKQEAKAMMEYWAKSGVMREVIDDRVVGEKWSLSGGGIPGELERACIKFRI